MVLPNRWHRGCSSVLAETQILVLNLARCLPPNLNYNLYLDNLFTNVPLAKELLKLDVGMTGKKCSRLSEVACTAERVARERHWNGVP